MFPAQPEPVHGDDPDRMASPAYRRRSGWTAAAALGLLGIVSVIGAFMPYTAGMNDPIAPWLVTTAYAALALVALTASALEAVRARRAETFMAVAIILAVGLTWASVMNGWFIFSPFMVGATLFTILALANRAIVRDELRHVSRDDTHARGEGPVPAHAGVEETATQEGTRPRGRSRRGVGRF